MRPVRKHIRSCLALAVLLLSACGQGEQPAPPASGQGPADDAETLWFAVHPYDNPSRLMERFEPLCRYLGSRLGHPVRLYIAQTYGDQIRRIAHGQVDLAYMGPTPYLRAHDHFLVGRDPTLQLIAAETVNGTRGYHSVLVTLRGSDIKTVSDIAGRTLALGSPRSFGAHYVPRTMLLRAGITLRDLKDFSYLGRHERVALAVVHGDFEAGGLREEIADRYLDRGLRIIAKSPLLPSHVIVASPGLAPDRVERLRRALLEPGPDAKAALSALGQGVGFAPVTDADFAIARAVVAAIESARPRGPLPW